MKPPGLYYAYALIQAITRGSLAGAHFVFLLINLLTTWLIYRFSMRLWGEMTGVVAGVSFAILSLIPHVSGFTTQSEHLVILFVALGMDRWAKGVLSEKWQAFFWAGVWLGMAMMIRQSGLFYGLLLGLGTVGYWALKKPFRVKEILRYGSIYTGGILAAIGFWLIVMALQGALDEMWYWGVTYPASYSTGNSFSRSMRTFWFYIDKLSTNYLLLWLLAGLGLLGQFFLRIPPHLKIFAPLIALLAFATVWPGLRFYNHYWLQVLPGAAVLCGLGMKVIERLGQKVFTKKDSPSFIQNYLPISFFCLILLPTFIQERAYYVDPDTTSLLKDVYGTNPFPEAKVIGDFLAQEASPDDQLALIGSEPELYFYTGMKSPSRHAYFSYLVNHKPGWEDRQAEFIRAIETHQPRYIVQFKHPISLLIYGPTAKPFFEWFDPYVAAYYEQIGLADMLPDETIYRWGKEMADYAIKGEYQVMVYRLDGGGS